MKKLDWYIVKKFVGTFFFAIMILAIISCVIDLTEKLDDFVEKKAPVIQILLYFKNFIPHITALLFPLFIFIATIFFTSKMAYRSEIIAMLASGMSFQRFMRPYMIGGGAMCLVSLIANHWIVPAANKDRLAFEDRYVHEATTTADRDVHLRLSKEQYIYMMSYDYKGNIGYNFAAEKIKGTQLKEKLWADRASYDSTTKKWKLYSVRIRTNDGLKESFRFVQDTICDYGAFRPSDLLEDDAIKEALTTTELNRYIDKQKLAGAESLNFFYVEKYRRTAQPFAGMILIVIGASISSRRIRGGSGLHLALGIVISALYIMSMQFSNTFSTKAGMNPLLAVWIPNIIFGCVAFYLYRKQVK